MDDMNSGYHGWSMSKRATDAYEDGEKPKSRWTKTAMLEAIGQWADDEDRVLSEPVSKMTKAELFDRFLEYSSWHHTSKFANPTDFYSLDVSELTEASRPKTDAEKRAERRASQARVEAERRKAEDRRREEEKRAEAHERFVREFEETFGVSPDASFACFLSVCPEKVAVSTSRRGNEVYRISDPGRPWDGASCLVADAARRNFANAGSYDFREWASEALREARGDKEGESRGAQRSRPQGAPRGGGVHASAGGGVSGSAPAGRQAVGERGASRAR